MRKDRLRLVSLALISLKLLASCQVANTVSGDVQRTNLAGSPSPVPLLSLETSQNPASEEATFIAAWQKGPHSDTYDLSNGPNTYCARCHSPLNWDPNAKIDEPPNCVSCKFPSDEDTRIALSNPLVPESDWQSINCVICHLIENDDSVSQTAWLNATTGYHETISSPTELCEKCHKDTETLRHKRDLADGAHSDYFCTACHDAHTTAASCSDANCHASVLVNSPFIVGHDGTHAYVMCVACHDASGLEVGIAEDRDLWVSFRTMEVLGRANRQIYQSHYIEREVNCDRCHYSHNPWGLADELDLSRP